MELVTDDRVNLKKPNEFHGFLLKMGFSHPVDEKIGVVLEKPLFLIIVRLIILVAG